MASSNDSTDSKLLLESYDAIIEGWSRALDLRDGRDEEHAKQVIELTMRLARKLGLGELDMLQVRRGALLHDVGIMGVPDNILLKPGSLDEAEWEIMRMHPLFAHEMLSKIPILAPAIDIPYCHHEKWDGSGYPRGLSGEEIPLAARIFAVVDVWDTLCSDRPYRPGKSKTEAETFLRAEAGKQFDPQIVEIFLYELAKR